MVRESVPVRDIFGEILKLLITARKSREEKARKKASKPSKECKFWYSHTKSLCSFSSMRLESTAKFGSSSTPQQLIYDLLLCMLQSRRAIGSLASTVVRTLRWSTLFLPRQWTASLGRQCAPSRCRTSATLSKATLRSRLNWIPIGFQYLVRRQVSFNLRISSMDQCILTLGSEWEENKNRERKECSWREQGGRFQGIYEIWKF